MTPFAYTAPAGAAGPRSSAIPFRRLLGAELSKASDSRAARWLLAITAIATFGLVLAPMLAPASIDQTYTSYLDFTLAPIVTLLPVISILTLTSEWSQRTALSTFTLEPRRVRVLAAKVWVSVLGAGAATVFCALATVAAVGLATATGRTVEVDLNAGVVLGHALFLLLTVFMGLALGALVHNSAAAIVLSFVLPTAVAALGLASRLTAEWIDIATVYDQWVRSGEWAGHTVQIVFATVIWVAAPLAAGILRTMRRDVTF